MLIIGAKSFASELLEVFHRLNKLDKLAFYDDISSDLPEMLYDRFPIIQSEEDAKKYFKENGNLFALGLGKPHLRKKVADKFIQLGGELETVISPDANIGHFRVKIGSGCTIMHNALISTKCTLGKGCLVYYNTVITHDCEVGDFVEISPGAMLLGKSKVGSFTHIGANATVLPGITIGENVIVGAGSVVTKDLPDNCMVAGVPAVFKKQL